MGHDLPSMAATIRTKPSYATKNKKKEKKKEKERKKGGTGWERNTLSRNKHPRSFVFAVLSRCPQLSRRANLSYLRNDRTKRERVYGFYDSTILTVITLDTRS